MEQFSFFANEDRTPLWTHPENLRTFPNLLVTNSTGSGFYTNVNVFWSICPDLEMLLEEMIDINVDVIGVIIPDLTDETVLNLELLLHEGNVRMEESDGPEKLFNDLLYLMSSEVIDDFKIEKIQKKPFQPVLRNENTLQRDMDTQEPVEDNMPLRQRLRSKRDSSDENFIPVVKVRKKQTKKKVLIDEDYDPLAELMKERQKASRMKERQKASRKWKNAKSRKIKQGKKFLDSSELDEEEIARRKEDNGMKNAKGKSDEPNDFSETKMGKREVPLSDSVVEEENLMEETVNRSKFVDFAEERDNDDMPDDLSDSEIDENFISGDKRESGIGSHSLRNRPLCPCGCKTRGSLCEIARERGLQLEFKPTENLITEAEANEETVPCPMCNLSCRSSRLTYHMSNNHRKNIFQCSMCGIKITANFARKVLLHIQSHEPEEMCVACGVIERRQTHIQIYGKNHDEYCCYGECKDVKFKTFDERVYHVNEVHEGVMLFRCGHCDIIFNSTLMLVDHVKTHRTSSSKEIHPCGVCGKEFMSYYGMKNHEREKHFRSKAYLETHPCPSCGKVMTKRQLYNHLRHCRKPFKCEHCGKGFGDLSHLNHHVQSIHVPEDQRPYPCEVCGKRLSALSTLKNHMAIHKNKREYKCSICGFGFNDPSNKIQHERRVHKIKTDNRLKSF